MTASTISIVLIGTTAIVLLGWLWWQVPKWQLNSLKPKIPPHKPKERADVEDNFRKTFGQALGGAAVLIGAGFAFVQFREQQSQFSQQQKAAQEQQQTAQNQFREQQQAAHDLLVSNQVSKGFEQLAGEKIEMRLGGIYALEAVMNDKTSPQYHQPVLEALCAFVREKTKEKTALERPATDVQAALTVIGRRTEGAGSVDLSSVKIRGVNLTGANLRGADLNFSELSDFSRRAYMYNVNLRGAFLGDANLVNAYMPSADLSGASMSRSDLNSADLHDADLRAASMDGSDLSGADLHEAQLNLTNLHDSNLSSANLMNANLAEADLSGVDLSGANLSGANLKKGPNRYGGYYGDVKNLTQTQLDAACGTNTKLPDGLTLKPCSVP
jgi:uncharacterized protein YjbI with pentapeptide repeats